MFNLFLVKICRAAVLFLFVCPVLWSGHLQAQQTEPAPPAGQESVVTEPSEPVTPPEEQAPAAEEQPQPPAVLEAPPTGEIPESPAPVEQPPSQEMPVTAEEPVAPARPPIRLTVKESIKMALIGNRPFLDRIDQIRQRFGLGQVTLEQVIVVPDQAGNITEVRVPGSATGLAGAQSQFQATLSPSFSVSVSDSELSKNSQSESYGLSIGKRFVTGGSLSMASSMTSAEFENRTSSLGVAFVQPLLRGAWPFIVNDPVVSARSDLLKEEISLECCDSHSRQGLIFEAISQYYGILNQMELVDIAKKAVERTEKLYKATLAKLRVELATLLDVSRAEVQLSAQQRALNQAQQELGNRQETFKVFLGLDTKEQIELTDPVVHEPTEEIREENLPTYLGTAMKIRPDLQVARIRIEDADRRWRIARLGLLPDLGSTFSYSVRNLGGLDNVAEANEKSWGTSLFLSYPLPLTSQRINIEQSGVAVKREERLFREKQEEISKEIKTDVRNAVRSQEQITIAKSEIESADKKLKIANFRFERGLASNFDIVDAENNLIQARQNMTQTIVNYLIASARLKRDMGVLTYEE